MFHSSTPYKDNYKDNDESVYLVKNALVFIENMVQRDRCRDNSMLEKGGEQY